MNRSLFTAAGVSLLCLLPTFAPAQTQNGPRRPAPAPRSVPPVVRPHGPVRNLLLTPEDRRQVKVFHPFLTPDRRATVRKVQAAPPHRADPTPRAPAHRAGTSGSAAGR